MDTKICSCCKIEKKNSEFYNNKYGKNGLTNQCKQCMTVYRNSKKEYNRQYMENRRKNDNETIKENRRKSYHRNPKNKLYQSAKNRAKRNNIPFNITIDDIIIPERCPLLNVEFISGTKGNYQYTYSLDRIDNEKGYIKGNIQVITNKANSMKNCATLDELKVFCKNMLKIIENDIV